MIRELGVVTAITPHSVQVSTQLKTGCNGCQHQNHCGAGLLAKAFPHRNGTIELAGNYNFSVGEQVELLMPENAMVRFSLLLYGVPILAIAIAALIGQWLWPSQELAVIAFTIVAGTITVYALRLLFRSKDTQIRKALQIQTLANSDA
ncbi:SoxR reducing system RseC family protein [Aliidiomarina quisquiliarum]|uniref:SoxR reducing system RseC family protein n=1 Tax=Aliidiomarina quisquiliarum TaxID=2938947 RepID=UPI00208FB58A|nr:SoxR reducing system RseC family protein [Aliidiomarina quisquiliarum]MCO4320578.1 SoxR reducing system RseC family protein [Aliidiomarina quisquiliarum]